MDERKIMEIEYEMQNIIKQLKREKFRFFMSHAEVERLFEMVAQVGILAIRKSGDPYLNQLKGSWTGYEYGIPVLVDEGMYSFVVDITKKMGGTDPYTFASKALAKAGNTFAVGALIELSKSGQKASRDIAKHYLDKINR